MSRNLLIVTTYYPHEKNVAVGTFVYRQVNEIKEYFNKVYVISLIPYIPKFLYRLNLKFIPSRGKPNHLAKDYTYDNVEVQYIKTLRLPFFFGFYEKRNFKKILRKLKKDKKSFDIIHAHFGIAGKIVSQLKNKYNAPLLVSFYGYDAYQKEYNSRYYKKMFKNSDCILSLSAHMSTRLENLSCSSDKIQILHLGVDTEKFCPIKLKKIIDRKIKILLVGNFVEKKGHFDAINAFYIVNKKFKNLHFTIIGRGSLEAQIKQLISKLNLQQNVTIINNYLFSDPRKIILENMQQCDIFLLPSRKSSNGDCEGTPVVLMEASACEKPCITTDHSGNPDIVIHNKTGFVVPEKSIDGIVKRLSQLVENEKLREKFGASAREYIILEYNSKIQKEKLKQIYSSFDGII